MKEWLRQNYRGLALLTSGICLMWLWVEILPDSWIWAITDWWENLTGGSLISIGDEG